MVSPNEDSGSYPRTKRNECILSLSDSQRKDNFHWPKASKIRGLAVMSLTPVATSQFGLLFRRRCPPFRQFRSRRCNSSC